jgi:hypothetical protein
MVYVNDDGSFAEGGSKTVEAPDPQDARYDERLADGIKLRSRMTPLTPEGWLKLRGGRG